MDQLYFDDGYLEVYYFTIVREAAATFSVTASQSFSGDIASTTGYYIPDYIEIGYFSGTIKQAEANLATAFTLTATITHIEGIALFAFSDAAISLQVSRIREINVTASAVFDIATDFVVARSADADVDAVFSAIIAGLRSRDVNLTTQAAFSFAADADKLKLSEINLTAVCAISVTARQVRDAHLTGTGVAALTCSASRTALVSAQIQTTVTIAANGGKRILYAAALTASFSFIVSRYVGSDRPKTLTGTFNGSLVNSATRVSDLRALATAENWYYETHVNATGSPSFDVFDRDILNIPLGNKGDFNFQLRYRSNQGLTLGGNGLGTNFALVSPGTLAISFTNGERVAVYVNGVRVAFNTTFNSSGWVITNPQTVTFGGGFPYTFAGKTMSSATDYAWLTLGDYTNNGATTYTAPTVANTDDTLFLYQFNNGNEDLGATLQGSANIQTQVVVSAVANKVTQANSSLSSQFAVSAVIGSIEQINFSAFSNAAVTATVTRIKSISSACESTSAFTADAVVTRSANVTVSAEVLLSAESSRTRPFTADLTAFVSQLAGVVRIAGFIVDDISVFSQSVIANKTAEAVVSLSVASTLDCTATRIKQFNAATTVISTFTVDAIVAKIAQADLVMAFAVIASDNRIRGTGFAGQIDSQLLAIGNNLTKIEFIAFALGSLTVVPNRRASLISAVVSDSTVNASGNRIRNLSAALSNNTAITTVADVVTSVTVTLQAFVSQITAAVELSDLQAEFSVTSSLAVSASRTRNITTAVIINTAVAVIIGKISGTGAAMPSSFAVAANGGRRVNGQATIASAMQFTVTVREIRLDNIVYVIPGETRVYAIKGETRIHKIRQETRIYTI